MFEWTKTQILIAWHLALGDQTKKVPLAEKKNGMFEIKKHSNSY